MKSFTTSVAKRFGRAIAISALRKKALLEGATDAVYFDQYSGVIVGKATFADRSPGARARSTFKPVHTGSNWGTPSKIVGFIVCLPGVTFLITGTTMWINRSRKKARVERKKEV